MTPSTDSDIANYARFSWLCPLLAWGSQVVSALTLRGVPDLGVFWLLLCIIQIGLLGAGLYLGITVLVSGRANLSSNGRGSAILGVVLSGGTILLVLGLLCVEMMR
jgi:hypothetical protein